MHHMALHLLCARPITDLHCPRDEEDGIFQHNNVPYDMARSVRTCREKHDQDFKVLPWPPNSPNLNLNENLRNYLSHRVRRLSPPPCTLQQLWNALQTAWLQIPGTEGADKGVWVQEVSRRRWVKKSRGVVFIVERLGTAKEAVEERNIKMKFPKARVVVSGLLVRTRVNYAKAVAATCSQIPRVDPVRCHGTWRPCLWAVVPEMLARLKVNGEGKGCEDERNFMPPFTIELGWSSSLRNRGWRRMERGRQSMLVRTVRVECVVGGIGDGEGVGRFRKALKSVPAFTYQLDSPSTRVSLGWRWHDKARPVQRVMPLSVCTERWSPAHCTFTVEASTPASPARRRDTALAQGRRPVLPLPLTRTLWCDEGKMERDRERIRSRTIQQQLLRKGSVESRLYFVGKVSQFRLPWFSDPRHVNIAHFHPLFHPQKFSPNARDVTPLCMLHLQAGTHLGHLLLIANSAKRGNAVMLTSSCFAACRRPGACAFPDFTRRVEEVQFRLKGVAQRFEIQESMSGETGGPLENPPTATIPTCKNLGAIPPGIEPGSLRVGGE
ncbi:hypothetical protein PR048_003307 [Dryococelus australis]|uniref:Uncharacterized protein n=1 Tax=Dryococelus australis TaxID=614101 RepID=A0ABQ9IMQ5_9NEOP|nr:hypothetical protein PR048_003307 [Dryococelus australis]